MVASGVIHHPTFTWVACWVSHVCRSATGYRTVLREPLPTRTQGISPSLVSFHKWRAEMPRAFEASRGRKARGEEMLVGIMLTAPTSRLPLSAACITVGATFHLLRAKHLRLESNRW